MPIYEYRCQKHGRFEIRQPMDSERKANCLECGEPADFRISLSSFRVAVPFTVVNSDGMAIHHQSGGGNTLPPVEDIARDAKKEYDYA